MSTELEDKYRTASSRLGNLLTIFVQGTTGRARERAESSLNLVSQRANFQLFITFFFTPPSNREQPMLVVRKLRVRWTTKTY